MRSFHPKDSERNNLKRINGNGRGGRRIRIRRRIRTQAQTTVSRPDKEVAATKHFSRSRLCNSTRNPIHLYRFPIVLALRFPSRKQQQQQRRREFCTRREEGTIAIVRARVFRGDQPMRPACALQHLHEIPEQFRQRQ